MKKRTLFIAAATLAACRTLGQSGDHSGSQTLPETHPKDPIVRAPEAAPDAGPPKDVKPPPPKDEPTPRWGKLPETSGELFSVIDGACRQLRVTPVENAMLVMYNDNNKAVMAKLDDDGGLEKLPLASAPEKAPWLHNVHNIVGRWPDGLWLAYDDGGRCTYREGALHLAAGKWKAAFDVGEIDSISGVQPYKDGALALHRCATDCSDIPAPGCTSGTIWSDALAKTPPVALGSDYNAVAFTSLPTGELFVVGDGCGAKDAYECPTAQLRWWSPGGKVEKASFSPGKRTGGAMRILARSPKDVIISHRNALFAFDGTSVKKLATAADDVYELLDRGAEGVWAVSQAKLFAVGPDAKVTDITPPREGKGSGILVAATKGEAGWVANGDALYRRDGASWVKVALPRPPFSSTSAYLTPVSIAIRAPDDVWVTASYHEQQPGWNDFERRTTVLRTKRPKQTLRCRVEPTSWETNIGGIMAWPAPGGDACKTPFVVLAPVSRESPKTNDYPKSRALLRPHLADIPDGAIVEMRGEEIGWIGVRASSLEAARKIALTYNKNYPMSHSEVVCADPEPTRTIAIDPKAKDGGP